MDSTGSTLGVFAKFFDESFHRDLHLSGDDARFAYRFRKRGKITDADRKTIYDLPRQRLVALHVWRKAHPDLHLIRLIPRKLFDDPLCDIWADVREKVVEYFDGLESATEAGTR